MAILTTILDFDFDEIYSLIDRLLKVFGFRLRAQHEQLKNHRIHINDSSLCGNKIQIGLKQDCIVHGKRCMEKHVVNMPAYVFNK